MPDIDLMGALGNAVERARAERKEQPMTDYTPTTEQIVEGYSWSGHDSYVAVNRLAKCAEFDRWLTAHDAEKRAEWEDERASKKDDVNTTPDGVMDLEEAKAILEVLVARRSSRVMVMTEQRAAARVILDHLAEQGEVEWGWHFVDHVTGKERFVRFDDRELAEHQAKLCGESPRYLTSEVVSRRKAGPWMPVDETGRNA